MLLVRPLVPTAGADPEDGSVVVDITIRFFHCPLFVAVFRMLFSC